MCFDCMTFLPEKKLMEFNFEEYKNREVNEDDKDTIGPSSRGGEGTKVNNTQSDTGKIEPETEFETESKTIDKPKFKIESRSNTEEGPKCGYPCELKSWGSVFPCNLYDFTKPDRFSSPQPFRVTTLHPWHVSIYKNDQLKCYGTLIKSDIVLTADTCIEGEPSDYVLKVGDKLDQELSEFGAGNLRIIKTETEIEGFTLIKTKHEKKSAMNFPDNSDLGLGKGNPEISDSIDFVGTMVRPVCLGMDFEDGITEFIGFDMKKEHQAPVTKQILNVDGSKPYYIETTDPDKKLGGWLTL